VTKQIFVMLVRLELWKSFRNCRTNVIWLLGIKPKKSLQLCT